MVYGHRRKEDCADIELLAPPGGNREAMADRVRDINPKGKTPISEALLIAAEQLGTNEDDTALVGPIHIEAGKLNDLLLDRGILLQTADWMGEPKPYYYRLLNADGEIIGSWRNPGPHQHGSKRETLVDELVVEAGTLLELEI